MGKEGPRPRDFIAQLLTEAVSTGETTGRPGTQDKSPENQTGGPSVTLHFKTALLPHSIYNTTKGHGKEQPGIPGAENTHISRLSPICGQRYGLIYPARLMVTHEGVKMSFTDPKKAQDYAKKYFGQPQQTMTAKWTYQAAQWGGQRAAYRHLYLSMKGNVRTLTVGEVSLMRLFLFLFSLFSLPHPFLFPSLVYPQKEWQPTFLTGIVLNMLNLNSRAAPADMHTGLIPQKLQWECMLHLNCAIHNNENVFVLYKSTWKSSSY